MLLTVLTIVEAGFVLLTFTNSLRALIGPDPYALFVLISTNIAFLVAWIGIRLTVADNSSKRQFLALLSAMRDVAGSRPGVRTLVDQDFYERFGRAIRDARTGVAITHLDTRPPNRNKKTPAAEYYLSVQKMIKANALAGFRRVERASPEKREWLAQLRTEFTNVGNFSLGILLLPGLDRRTGLVSVQLVDDSESVLVAIAEHDSSFGVRDVWITDRATNDLWRHYFEDVLWRPAAKVIENGQVNAAEWDRVMAFIEQQ